MRLTPFNFSSYAIISIISLTLRNLPIAAGSRTEAPIGRYLNVEVVVCKWIIDGVKCTFYPKNLISVVLLLSRQYDLVLLPMFPDRLMLSKTCN